MNVAKAALFDGKLGQRFARLVDLPPHRRDQGVRMFLGIVFYGGLRNAGSSGDVLTFGP